MISVTYLKRQLAYAALCLAGIMAFIPSANATFFNVPKHPLYVGGGIGMGSTYWNRVQGIDDGRQVVALDGLVTSDIGPDVFHGAPSKAGGYGFAYDTFVGFRLNNHFAVQVDFTGLPGTQVVIDQENPVNVTIHGLDGKPIATGSSTEVEKALDECVNSKFKACEILGSGLARIQKQITAADNAIHTLTQSAYPECQKSGGCNFVSHAYAFDVVGKFIAPFGKRYSAFATVGPSWTIRSDMLAHRKSHLGGAFGIGLGANFGSRVITTLEYDYRTGNEKSSVTPAYDYLPYNASLLFTTAIRFL